MASSGGVHRDPESPTRLACSVSIALLALTVPRAALAQEDTPVEDVVEQSLERFETMVMLWRDHGLKPGMPLVTYSRTLRADRSGYDVVGTGRWRGAEASGSQAGLVSLRLGHDVIRVQGAPTSDAVMHAVIDGEVLEGAVPDGPP